MNAIQKQMEYVSVSKDTAKISGAPLADSNDVGTLTFVGGNNPNATNMDQAKHWLCKRSADAGW